jgi:hypothetical protein
MRLTFVSFLSFQPRCAPTLFQGRNRGLKTKAIEDRIAIATRIGGVDNRGRLDNRLWL